MIGEKVKLVGFMVASDGVYADSKNNEAFTKFQNRIILH
uniref:Uncharacterized protein n=1 Tax=Lepeophtheirus salmonis TaxID=72036 RepID=A0A0K2VAS4_LEPSM